MVIIILSILIVALILWILFAPLTIRIDSIRNKYAVYLPGIVRIYLSLKKSDFGIFFKIFFLKFRIFPGKKHKSKEKKVEKKVRNKNRNRSLNIRPFITDLIQSFRIKSLKINIDTGDFPLNGQLYPAFYMLDLNTKYSMQINFNNENEAYIKITNTIFKLIKIYVKHSFKK